MVHPSLRNGVWRADAEDAGDGEGMELGACGDEIVRSGRGGQGEVQSVGGLHAGGGAEVGETLGEVGAEGL